MKKSIAIINILLLAAFSLTACNMGKQVIDEDMDGQTVKVKAGDTFILKLWGNPTTGYSWNMEDNTDNIVSLNGDPEYKSDSLLTGSGGTYTYTFTAANAGTTTLKFNYLRTWEKDPPYKTFTITIDVE